MLRGRPVDAHVGVAVGQVFIAEVETSDETRVSVHHEQFPMVAEVDLEAVAPAPRRLEAGDLDPRLPHCVKIRAR